MSNVRREIVIPPQWGSWEACERDGVNTEPPYRGVAFDPLGIDPPVGGEINTMPTRGWEAQVQLIEDLLEYLRSQGETPAVGCTNVGHVHVHVPGLIENPEALKRLARYVFANQADFVRICGRYEPREGMDAAAKRYFKLDGGRQMPQYIHDNIQKHTKDLDSFIKMHCAGKDAVSMGRPFRYAINMYCLKHVKTVEFRPFRATLDPSYLYASFQACGAFMDAALNDGPSFANLGYTAPLFAPMDWDREMWDGFVKTKWDDKRGKKERHYIEVPE